MFDLLLLFLLAIGASAVGSLVGAGGGFLLVPALYLVGPYRSPTLVTALGLALALTTGLAGSRVYLRQGRVRGTLVLPWTLGVIPGAVTGPLLIPHIPGPVFARGLGLLLLVAASLLEFCPDAGRRHSPVTSVLTGGHRLAAIGAGLAVGLIASLFGIGGGTLLVPLLILAFRLPSHLATATSLAVVVILAGVATGTHLLAGHLAGQGWPVGVVAAGAALGAPWGAHLSRLLGGRVLVRVVELTLVVAGLRLLIAG